MARRESTSRSITRSTSLRVPAVNGQDSALVEFHALAGHAGPADGCQDCAKQLQRQRRGAAGLRVHQRQARQRVDTILRKAVTS